MPEEKWSLNPETMKEIRREASTGLGLDNGYASTVILNAFDLIEGLRSENKRFREFIQEVREFDPRTDYYANELHGDACEALGLCRCCGQEVCDDA